MTTNMTTVSGFLLLGFSDTQKMQILQALLFLVMYMLFLAGNLIIVTITTLDPQFESPMYYFLKQLALLDISSLTITIPQSIHNSLTGSGYICYAQCVLQIFFAMSLTSAEVTIFTVMSYDCYVAICLPPHYEVIMSLRKCRWAVTAVFISGGIPGSLYAATTFSIRFCRAKIIHQFFCDVPQLLKLSCSKDYPGVVGVAVFMAVLAFTCFNTIDFSYVQIFSTVLRMPSAEGQSKVFFTWLPHITVISFFLLTGACTYLQSTSESSTLLDLLLYVFYTVLSPTLNPLIYCLRNESMKIVLRKSLCVGTLT